MYEVKLFDKTVMTVTKKQADIIMQQSTSDKAGIVINGEYVAFKGISSITEITTPTTKQSTQQLPAPPTASNIKYRTQWLECIARNKELLIKKQPPKWKVDSEGKIVKAESDYFNLKDKKPVVTTWVKQRVSQKKWDSLFSQSPGYRFMEQVDNGIIMAFKTVTEPIAHHLEKLTDFEVKRFESKSHQS